MNIKLLGEKMSAIQSKQSTSHSGSSVSVDNNCLFESRFD